MVAESVDAPKVSMENDQHEMKSSWLTMKVHSKETRVTCRWGCGGHCLKKAKF